MKLTFVLENIKITGILSNFIDGQFTVKTTFSMSSLTISHFFVIFPKLFMMNNDSILSYKTCFPWLRPYSYMHIFSNYVISIDI